MEINTHTHIPTHDERKASHQIYGINRQLGTNGTTENHTKHHIVSVLILRRVIVVQKVGGTQFS